MLPAPPRCSRASRLPLRSFALTWMSFDDFQPSSSCKLKQSYETAQPRPLSTLKLALSVVEAERGLDSPEAAITLERLAQLSKTTADPVGAFEYHERAVDVDSRRMGSGSKRYVDGIRAFALECGEGWRWIH